MGLLDDAIREHLDLKRKRGADPAEVEKAERDALGPVRREPTQRGQMGVPHLQVNTQPSPADARAGGFNLEDEATVLRGAPVNTPVPEPKRGFLRRHRPAPAPEPAPTDFTQHLDAEFPDDREAFLEQPPLHDPLHDSLDMPTELHALPEEHHEAEPPAASAPEPPHLTFDSAPPPRPTFSAQPPAINDRDEVVTGEPALDETAVHHVDPEHQDDLQSHEIDDLEAHRATFAPNSPSHPTPAAAVSIDLDHDEPGGINLHRDEPGGFEPDAHEPGETTEWDVEHAFAAEDAGHAPEAPPQPEPARQTQAPQQPPHAPQQPPHAHEHARPDVEEDVLEETPEFLQDTPDHDRLWFEQRPPRDFDFDG